MSIISFAADCDFMELRRRAASIRSNNSSFAGDPSKGASGTSRADELYPVPLVLCKDLASIMSIISFIADCVFMDLRQRAEAQRASSALLGTYPRLLQALSRAH